MKNVLKKLFFISIPLLIVLIIVEIIIRFLNIPVLQDEPYFFGFAGCPPYFQKTTLQTEQEVYASNPQKNIETTSFNVNKAENTFRIFTLGGSATYGEPFGPAGAFSHWLEVRLNTLYAGKNFEMINCGRKGFGSVRVKIILSEVVDYEPDLILVYFGNNEVRDYHFHRMEINVEIRPLFNTAKKILDNSHIFRMIFHLFLKKHITSYGAETIRNVIKDDLFNKNVFSQQVEYINSRRQILDSKHGGLWVSKLDSSNLSKDENLDKVIFDLNRTDIWPEKIKDVFRIDINHIIKKCKAKNVPLIFLTLTRNLYYNKDARLLFEKYYDGNKVIKEVCSKENIPVVKTLPLLIKEGREEIGFNMFMDIVHPTLWANQIIANEITKKIIELNLVDAAESLKTQHVEKKLDLQDKFERENFEFNSQYYSLIGWQKLICMKASNNDEAVKDEIISIANKALALDPNNEKAYLLLGALYSLLEDFENVKMIWEKMKLQYSDLKI